MLQAAAQTSGCDFQPDPVRFYSEYPIEKVFISKIQNPVSCEKIGNRENNDVIRGLHTLNHMHVCQSQVMLREVIRGLRTLKHMHMCRSQVMLREIRRGLHTLNHMHVCLSQVMLKEMIKGICTLKHMHVRRFMMFLRIALNWTPLLKMFFRIACKRYA